MTAVVPGMGRPRLRREEYCILPTAIGVARALVEQFHYARGAANTAVYIWGLYHRRWIDPSHCLAITWFMPPIKPAAVRFAGPDWRRCLMLSRSVAVPWAPANSMSYLIGGSLRGIHSHARYAHVVTYADEYMARVPAHKRIPGVIYRATNAQRLGPTRPTHTYVDRQTGRQVSPKAGPVTRSHARMLELGYEDAGYFRRWRYGWHLEPVELSADDLWGGVAA